MNAGTGSGSVVIRALLNHALALGVSSWVAANVFLGQCTTLPVDKHAAVATRVRQLGAVESDTADEPLEHMQ